MNTKLGKVLTYSERFPSIKPHDPLTLWSGDQCEATWQFQISTIHSMQRGMNLSLENYPSPLIGQEPPKNENFLTSQL